MILDLRGIDLDSRLNSGRLLSLGEVEDLARLCRLHLDDLSSLSGIKEDNTPKVVSLQKVRMETQRQTFNEVEPEVAATRLLYIRRYIQWLADERCSRRALTDPEAARLAEASSRTLRAINSRIPHQSGHKSLGQREGVASEVVDEMLRVIDPHCPDNPWRHQHTRYRNALLIHWLRDFGFRIGEALGMRVSDVDARAKEVTIHRRADDREDPRAYPPQTKTNARTLPCSDALLLETQAYILDLRPTQGASRRHPFLFVASRTGKPMTLSAAAKMFRTLREKCPGLPADLTAHLLRHTWNDVFSKKMEIQRMEPAEEQKIRSYMMGWSPTSGTAATYTRRYVRIKAKEVSRARTQKSSFSTMMRLVHRELILRWGILGQQTPRRVGLTGVVVRPLYIYSSRRFIDATRSATTLAPEPLCT
ncbi:MAG: tyrosine-type recombinase/integrase [Rhodanobacteraceae bacterium]